MSGSKVVQHYDGTEGVHARMAEGLRRVGLDPEHLSPEDLAPMDQFHTGGQPATVELADLAGIRDMKVIDLGGGLGGPARTLASQRGCDVTVLDLSPEFCTAGERFARATGLADRARFQVGDALAAPFDDASFDAVWTQHSTMNIADKAALYREAHRLLRPGGVIAMHEIAAGPVQPIHFPVPWAGNADISFLVPPHRLRELLASAAFTELAWRDVTRDALAFYEDRAASSASGAPPLGLHLVLGERFAEAFRNLIPNVKEHRITVVQAVLRRM